MKSNGTSTYGLGGFSALVFLGLLSGCATPITHEAMVPQAFEATHKHLATVSVLATGGQETESTGKPQISNSALAQALTDSIVKSRTFSKVLPGKTGDFLLTVSIFTLDQPSFGLSFTVKLEAGWTLRRADTNAIVWQEAIKSEFTATTSDAFAAVTRLNLATQGAARTNIAQGLTKISALTLPFDDPAPSGQVTSVTGAAPPQAVPQVILATASPTPSAAPLGSPSQGKKLTGDEIIRFLRTKKIQINLNVDTYTLSPNGSLLLSRMPGKASASGRWSVTNDQLCMDIERVGYPLICASAVRKADDILELQDARSGFVQATVNDSSLAAVMGPFQSQQMVSAPPVAAPSLAKREVKLNSDAILRILRAKRFKLNASNDARYELSPNGQLTSSWDYNRASSGGKWRVANDQVCLDSYRFGYPTMCFVLIQTADYTVEFRDPGTGYLNATIKDSVVGTME